MAMPLVDQIQHGLQYVALNQIWPNPLNPRQRFEPEALAELVASVRELGILEPLVLTPATDEGEGYLVVAGERRRQAAVEVGLTWVPAVIRDLDTKDQLALMLAENIIRADLDPIEEARGLRQLLDECGLKQEDLARRIGKSQPWISNRLRLLRLPETVLERLQSGELSAGHAQVLLQYEAAPKTLEAAAKRIIKDRIPVADVGAKAVQGSLDKAEHRALSEYSSGFDLKDCKGCEYDKTPGWNRVCLNPDCYDRKQAEAVAAKQAEVASKTTGLTRQDLVAAGRQIAQEWDFRRARDAACESCSNRQTVSGWNNKPEDICLDPDCCSAKSKAKDEAEKQARREKAEAELAAIKAAAETARDGFTNEHLVLLLCAFLRGEPRRRTYSPEWPGRNQLLGNRFGKQWPIDDYNQDLDADPSGSQELIDHLLTRKPGLLRAALLEWALIANSDYLGPARALAGLEWDKPSERGPKVCEYTEEPCKYWDGEKCTSETDCALDGEEASAGS